MSFDSVTQKTTITLPYKPTGPDVRVVTRQDKVDGYTRGRVFPVESVTNFTVVVTGDLTGYKFYIGQRITAIRRESKFFMRSDKGAAPQDILSVNRLFLTMANTGYTRIEVTTPNRGTKVYEAPLRVMGTPSATLGTPVPRNMSLQAEVGDRADNVTIDIINDSFLPSYWQSAAYEYSAVGWAGQK
jgi:hypothetical protein